MKLFNVFKKKRKLYSIRIVCERYKVELAENEKILAMNTVMESKSNGSHYKDEAVHYILVETTVRSKTL